jgi:D-glycerate 3-kinase
MNPATAAVITQFIKDEKLPAEYASTVDHWFMPALEEILQRVAAHQGTFVIGVSGSQGSGKSTLAALFVRLMHAMLGLRCISLSIDDFYLTHAQRQQLAQSVHPLLATRGVPGTHDVTLAMKTINALKNAGAVAIPRFDKAVDDRKPTECWPVVQAPVDVIVLEGWCLSIDAQTEATLEHPVNSLEADEDIDGTWRRYVNATIGKEYQDLYAMVDFLVMLKAPDFDKVYEWRQNQENKLAESYRSQQGSGSNHRIMSPAQLQRFIQHYERVTRHGLETLPHKADVVFQLTDRQTIDKRL